MSVFIKGAAAISSQDTFEHNSLPKELREFHDNKLLIEEPSYDGLIDPRAIRRMSKIIRISVAAANKALSQANIPVPDGIITGTSYGCLEDTEIFLQKLITNKEEALNPTPFIQSTHNTISGQIALLLKCFGYNSTYTQRGFSFENALLDADTQLEENGSLNLLIGGVDEIIDVSHDILRRFDLYRKDNISNLELKNTSSEGTLNGEGCSYFVLSGDPENALAELVAARTFYKPDHGETESILDEFLKEENIKPDEIDLVLVGRSGDSRHDHFYDSIEGLCNNSTTALFKHISGDYPTASAFATWIATRLLVEQNIPGSLILRDNGITNPGNVLIYNHYFGVHHSLILLRK